MGLKESKERYDSKLFSAALIKKNYAIYPILVLWAAHGVCTTAMCTWMIYTRDCIWKRGTLPVNMKIDLLNPRRLKLLHIEEELNKLPELHEAYNLLREAEKDRDKKLEEIKKQPPEPKDTTH